MAKRIFPLAGRMAEVTVSEALMTQTGGDKAII